jgi:hypothetical protein
MSETRSDDSALCECSFGADELAIVINVVGPDRQRIRSQCFRCNRPLKSDDPRNAEIKGSA